MEKTKEQLIEVYKRANKERREKLAKKNGFKSGADYLASLQKRKSVKVKLAKKVTKKEMLDYVVAFDTTGSMSSYIGDVKKHVEKLIPEMFSNKDLDLKMRIIAFGDYCDMSSSTSFGNAYQESEFTDNENSLIEFVKNAQGTSGGDGDEFYELVIKKITEETPWRKGAKRTVLFIADAEPHPVGYSYENIIKNAQIDWEEEAKKARKQDIQFDTMSIHGTQFYKDLSKITNGVYLKFSSSEKTASVFVASAYSRGSAETKSKFTAYFSTAMASGDSELIGMYKSLSTKLDE